jgi:hypothetical protein
MKQEPSPIDHMDEPGEYREQVRAGVFSRFGVLGRPVEDCGHLAGAWDVYFVSLVGPDPNPAFLYRLDEGGRAALEMIGQPGPPTAGEWRLNPDGTFSLVQWCPHLPELGILEPQLEEDRRHVAALPDGRLVAWNGDGSSVLLLSPRQERGDPA